MRAQITNSNDICIGTINIRIPEKKDSVNHWSNRKELIRDFIRDENLDVVCMQEVLYSQLKYLANTLKDYSFVGDSPNIVKGEEYLPIFFKQALFTCIDNGTFWLSETPDSIGSQGWDGKHPRRATWVRLKHKNGKEFYLVNTHLDHVGKLARLKGMELIKHRLESVSRCMPLILCGDMNFSTISQPYFIALNDRFLMYDAYQIAKERRGVTYTYHGFGKRVTEKQVISDLILVTKQIYIEKIDIPKEKKMNGVYLSDHCPVIATIGFKDL